MRRTASLGSLAALALALAGLAAAQETPVVPAGHVAWPIAPREAHVGDWVALVGTFVEARCCNASRASRLVLVERVSAVEGALVRLDETEVLAGKPLEAKREYRREGTFELAKLVVTPSEPKLTGPEVASEERTVAGRTFATSKLTVHAVPGGDAPLAEAGTSYELWLSAEVPGPGFVALRIRDRDAAGNEYLRELEVAGFGTAEKVVWGKAADEVLK